MERGFPAAFLFLGIFGGVLGLAVLSFFTTRKATSFDHDAFAVLSIGSITGVLLHNMIDFNLQFTGISIGCIVLLGLLVPPVVPVRDAVQPSFRRWRIRKIFSRADIVIAILLFSLVLWEGAFLATSSLGRHAMAKGDDEKALAWFGKSHLGLFSRDLYLSEAQLRLKRGDTKEAFDALTYYLALNDHDPRAWKILGMLYMQTGDDARAVNSLMAAYERGKYTDIGIMRLLLEAARRSGRQEVITDRKLEFDRIFSAYAQAIEQNTHFIALSQNVEDLQSVASLLSALYPADADQYRSIAHSAEAHAVSERQKYSARQPGILW
jgi:tetratricopeptide (TPR) repeat protein